MQGSSGSFPCRAHLVPFLLGSHWTKPCCDTPFFILLLPLLEFKPLFIPAVPVLGKMEHPIAHDEDQDVEFLAAVSVPTHKESICFQAAQDQSWHLVCPLPLAHKHIEQKQQTLQSVLTLVNKEKKAETWRLQCERF